MLQAIPFSPKKIQTSCEGIAQEVLIIWRHIPLTYTYAYVYIYIYLFFFFLTAIPLRQGGAGAAPQAGWFRHARTASGPGYRPYAGLRRQKLNTRARLYLHWITCSLAVPCMVITATEYSVKPPSHSAHLAEVCTNMTGLSYGRLQQALLSPHPITHSQLHS